MSTSVLQLQGRDEELGPRGSLPLRSRSIGSASIGKKHDSRAAPPLSSPPWPHRRGLAPPAMATDAIFQAVPYARRVEFDYYNKASMKRWFHCILAPVSEGTDELELHYFMGPDRNTMTIVSSDDFTPSLLRPPNRWSATVDKAAKKLAQQYGWSLAPLAEEGWQERGHEWLGKKVLLFHSGKGVRCTVTWWAPPDGDDPVLPTEPQPFCVAHACATHMHACMRST